jgi:hypothetical protein
MDPLARQSRCHAHDCRAGLGGYGLLRSSRRVGWINKPYEPHALPPPSFDRYPHRPAGDGCRAWTNLSHQYHSLPEIRGHAGNCGCAVVRNCGVRFLRPQIEMVRPRVVVCFGSCAYRAVLLAFGLRPGAFRAAVESHTPVMLPGGIAVVAVYHCGQRILNTHRSYAAQLRDWQRVRAILDTRMECGTRRA